MYLATPAAVPLACTPRCSIAGCWLLRSPWLLQLLLPGPRWWVSDTAFGSLQLLGGGFGKKEAGASPQRRREPSAPRPLAPPCRFSGTPSLLGAHPFLALFARCFRFFASLLLLLLDEDDELLLLLLLLRKGRARRYGTPLESGRWLRGGRT